MTAQSDARLQVLLDRVAIRDLVDTYAQGCDLRDEARFMGVFTLDAELDYSDAMDFRGTAAEIFGFIKQAQEHFAARAHYMLNHQVVLDGDRATGRTYHLDVHGVETPAGPEIMTFGGHYDDEYVRTPTGWLIAKRTAYILWSSDLSPEAVMRAFPSSGVVHSVARARDWPEASVLFS